MDKVTLPTPPSKPQSLRDRMAAYPDEAQESWRPKPGEILVGVIEHIETRTTRFATVPVLVIQEDETGALVEFWAVHTVARSELARKNVQPGDHIAIRRLADSAQGYKRYKVLLDRDRAATFNWAGVPVDGGDVDPADREPLLSSEAAPPENDETLPY